MPRRITVKLMLKDLGPKDLRRKYFIMVTKRVRVVVSTDWLVLG